MAEPILLSCRHKIMPHLQHAFHELNVMLNPVFDGMKPTLLCPSASVAGFLNQGSFWADIPPSTLRSDPELETSLDVVAQEVL